MFEIYKCYPHRMCLNQLWYSHMLPHNNPQDPQALHGFEDPGTFKSYLETSGQRGQGIYGSGQAQVAAWADLPRGPFPKAFGPCLRP